MDIHTKLHTPTTIPSGRMTQFWVWIIRTNGRTNKVKYGGGRAILKIERTEDLNFKHLCLMLSIFYCIVMGVKSELKRSGSKTKLYVVFLFYHILFVCMYICTKVSDTQQGWSRNLWGNVLWLGFNNERKGRATKIGGIWKKWETEKIK